MDTVTKNNAIIADIVNYTQYILAKSLEFSELNEGQTEKINSIQEHANGIRHDALSIEKIGAL